MTNNQPKDFSSFLSGLNSSESRQQAAKNIMSNMSAEENRKLFELLGDKEKLNAILNSPAAQNIISKLNGHK